MIENLVIVESPAKAKTIERFLGSNYTVKSSFGHIRDLEKKDLGIDIENNFQPKYEISADKKAVVKELKALAKEAKTVWLASDEDRGRRSHCLASLRSTEIKAGKYKANCLPRNHERCDPACYSKSPHIDRNLVNASKPVGYWTG